MTQRSKKGRGKAATPHIREEMLRLLDPTLIRVDRVAYDRFAAILDRPADEDGFERLMNVTRPWDP